MNPWRNWIVSYSLCKTHLPICVRCRICPVLRRFYWFYHEHSPLSWKFTKSLKSTKSQNRFFIVNQYKTSGNQYKSIQIHTNPFKIHTKPAKIVTNLIKSDKTHINPYSAVAILILPTVWWHDIVWWHAVVSWHDIMSCHDIRSCRSRVKISDSDPESSFRRIETGVMHFRTSRILLDHSRSLRSIFRICRGRRQRR